MLIYNSKLLGTPILSLRESSPIGRITKSIINPDNLQIIAFEATGPLISIQTNILDISAIREYSSYGIVIDSAEDFVARDEIIKISEVLSLNFDLIGLKVETKKGSKIGKITDYTINPDNYEVHQIIVKRPAIKSLIDPELTIPRSEIIEVSDHKIIIKDEVKTIKKEAKNAEFVPNFVNPFREKYPGFAPSDINNDSSKHQ